MAFIGYNKHVFSALYGGHKRDRLWKEENGSLIVQIMRLQERNLSLLTLRTNLLSPVPLRLDGLLVPRPPRHGGDDELEGLLTGVPELETGTGRNAYAHPGLEPGHLLPIPLPSPHLASAADTVPDLLDGPMVDGVRRLMRRQRAVGQLAAARPHENPYLGAVRG